MECRGAKSVIFVSKIRKARISCSALQQRSFERNFSRASQLRAYSYVLQTYTVYVAAARQQSIRLLASGISALRIQIIRLQPSMLSCEGQMSACEIQKLVKHCRLVGLVNAISG